jgi:membrane protease YdiL (CAAX protease family)
MNKLFDLKETLKGIGIICLYYIFQLLFSMPFIFLIKSHTISEYTATLFVYILLPIPFILIYLKDLKKDFKQFKTNYKKILLTTLKYWLVGIIIMIISSIVIALFGISDNINQEANINMLKQAPIIEILCAVIFGPILEELVFRRGLKNFTSNKHVYAITTGLIFAFIHIISSISNNSDIIMLIYLIPYGALGIAFGYAYKKTNNIFGTITFHSIHNLISLLEILLIGVIV